MAVAPFVPRDYEPGELWTADKVENLESRLGVYAQVITESVQTTVSQVDTNSQKYFSIPTGSDDAPELLSRLAAGESDIALRALDYTWSQQVAIPAGALVRGAGKFATKVTKGFNGDMIMLAQGAALEHMHLDGAGATRTGKGALIGATDGKQLIAHCRIIDFADYCLEFTAVGAGSQSMFLDCEMWQTLGTSAGKFAVKIPATEQLSGTPRKFFGIETEGNKFIYLGGCNTVIVVGGYVGEVEFTADTRGAIFTGVRVGVNEPTMTVDGHGNCFSACKINPLITIAPGADLISIDGSNTIEGGPIVDSSGSAVNALFTPRQTYTPTWTTGGTAPALGNGALSGTWSRDGDMISFAVEFTAGTTTTFGTAEFRFALPVTPVSAFNQIVPVMFYDGSANTYYAGTAIISGGTSYLTLRGQAIAGAITNASPFTWGSTDQLRIQGSYQL